MYVHKAIPVSPFCTPEAIEMIFEQVLVYCTLFTIIQGGCVERVQEGRSERWLGPGSCPAGATRGEQG
jgi:hypothetical protein